MIAAAIKHIWGIVNNRTSQMTSTGNNVRIAWSSDWLPSPRIQQITQRHYEFWVIGTVLMSKSNWCMILSMPPTIEFDVWLVATMYWVKAIIYLVPLPYTILSYFQRIYAGEGIHTRQKTKKVKNIRNAKILFTFIISQCSILSRRKIQTHIIV